MTSEPETFEISAPCIECGTTIDWAKYGTTGSCPECGTSQVIDQCPRCAEPMPLASTDEADWPGVCNTCTERQSKSD
jgi:hypothetical protein